MAAFGCNSKMTADLSEKVTIVTGANSGIGEAIAIMFAERGALVTLCGRNEERLLAAKERCIKAGRGHGKRSITVSGDITDPQVRSNIIQQTVDAFGKLDILILNAATVSRDDKMTVSEEVYDHQMSTNLKAAFFLSQAAIPHLEKSKGTIVAMSSIVTTSPYPNRHVVYSMAKAGLDQMTRVMALSLGRKGIRVNAVNPGAISATRSLRELSDGSDNSMKTLDEKVNKRHGIRHPLHGRCATPEEIAEVVAFLASDGARFISGQCLVVDAGFSITSVL